MKSVCVFCGSRSGVRPVYHRKAAELGRTLAELSLTLVYGGAAAGLMGTVADAALEKSGRVIGVIPELLVEREIAHRRLADLKIVGSMHERKALMYELSDAFVVMPGGIGTMEEFFEVMTWNAIGAHDKPCGLLNTGDYYRPLMALLDHMVEEGFMPPERREDIVVSDQPSELLDMLKERTNFSVEAGE